MIVWTKGEHSERGGIRRTNDDAVVPIWSVGYEGVHKDRERPWYLRCELPGIKRHVQCASPEEAKERAERQLLLFHGWLTNALTEADA